VLQCHALYIWILSWAPYVSNASNNDDVFWPWNDQFYKIFVRDQDPDVLNRMDQHTSYVTLASDENWDKPVNDTSGGYGRHSFMTHFDLLTNQHGYFSKGDEVYVQARVDILAAHNCIIFFLMLST